MRIDIPIDQLPIDKKVKEYIKQLEKMNEKLVAKVAELTAQVSFRKGESDTAHRIVDNIRKVFEAEGLWYND